MSKHACNVEQDLYYVWVQKEVMLDPKDYILYNDEDELRDALYEDLLDSCNLGEVRYKDCDRNVSIPDAFIEEWRELKKNELYSSI